MHRVGTKPKNTHVVKSNILVSPKIGTYGNEKSYFQPNIMHRYLMYVYGSTYFLKTFFNHGNYKKLGHPTDQKQRTEAATMEPSPNLYLTPCYFFILLPPDNMVTDTIIYTIPCIKDNNLYVCCLFSIGLLSFS